MVKVTTNNETTDAFIGVCLDKSGSMEPARADVIGGFNTFKADQVALGTTFFTIVMFDNYIVERANGVEGNLVEDLNAQTYIPGGGTALFDAIGRTITQMQTWLDAHPDFTGKTILVIQTDGFENASKEFTKQQIVNLINEKKNQGWAVVFMGADMDAFAAGGGFGISGGSTMSYAGSSTRRAMGQTLSASTSSYRQGNTTADTYFSATKDLDTDTSEQNTSDTSNLP